MSDCLRKHGVTLVELIVVLVIVAILVGLLLPAIHHSRESSRRIACQGNLHQLGVAMTTFVDLHRRVPDPCPEGKVGGWAIELLPFIEEAAPADVLAGNPSFDSAEALEEARKRPFIMTCPSAYERDSSIPTVPVSHYSAILTTAIFYDEATSSHMGGGRREQHGLRCSWWLGELPTDSRVPWVASPESHIGGPVAARPHGGGYNRISSSGPSTQSVEFRRPKDL